MEKNDRIYGIIGSVIGDIAGSRFEFAKGFPKKSFKLFGADSSFTDDSVLTIAVADALLNNRTYPDVFWEWGKKYPAAGFGRLLMELRDNGKLEYKLPADAFDFINILKE